MFGIDTQKVMEGLKNAKINTAPKQATPKPATAQTPQAGPKTPVTGGTESDIFAKQPNDKPPADAATINGHMAQVRERDAIVDRLLVKDSSVNEGDINDLQASLSSVNVDTLKYAEKEGVKFQIVKPGDSLIEKGIVQERSVNEVTQNAPETRRAANGIIDEVNGKYEPLLAQAKEADEQKKNQPHPPLTGGGMAAMMARIQDSRPQVEKVNEERRAEIDNKVREQTDNQAMLYNPFAAEGAPGGGFGGNHLLHMAKAPASTRQMAAAHGAQTPQEVNEFNNAVEALNGDRLSTARNETLANLEKALNDPKNKDNPYKVTQEQIDHLRQNTREIPVDHQKNDIIVPNRFYHRPGKETGTDENGIPTFKRTGTRTVVDQEGYQTLRGWQGNTEGVMSLEQAMKKGKNFEINSFNNGQYFPDRKLILLRGEPDVMQPEGNKNTPVHELGHALEFTLEEKRPDFYNGWKEQLDTAYGNVGFDPNRTVSDYSRINEREYLAEGYKFLHTDKKLLKTKDPKLFELTRQLDEVARQEGRKTN